MRIRAMIAIALLACLATPSDAGRKRFKDEPILVYFTPSLDSEGAWIRPEMTYAVQIPMAEGWETVLHVAQGSCLKYHKKFLSEETPEWIRVCWSDAVPGDGVNDDLECSDYSMPCDPAAPFWDQLGTPLADRCTEAACTEIRR